VDSPRLNFDILAVVHPLITHFEHAKLFDTFKTIESLKISKCINSIEPWVEACQIQAAL
jgi:hypothetical protein